MPIIDGVWQPSLFPKQWEGLRMCTPSKKNIVAFCGPRKSTKTWTAAHATANHCWETDRGNACLLTVTQGVGVDSGIWEHMTDLFLPEWIGGNFGMNWIKKPFVQGVTKKPTCVISNRYGNSTKLSLESLRTEDEVEARFKGKVYSMIWINEATKFKKRKTFDTLKQCLRCPQLTPEQHLLLMDFNPDLDIGTASWIYKLFYELKNDANPEVKELIPLRDSLNLLEFTVDDNLSMTEEDKKKLLADFSHDQDLVAAYYYGRWVTASADAIFFKVFRPNSHVVGQFGDPDPETMYPESDCIELHTSFDPGPINCAAVIIEPVKLPDGKQLIKCLDEEVRTGGPVDLQDFVNQMRKKMRFWERECGHSVQWHHHSDRSVFDQRDFETQKYYHQLIFDMSDGEIELQAFERSPGSLPAGIDLLKLLLWEDRLVINGSKCPKVVEMFKSIRRGKQQGQHVQKGSVHKHAFDALRYGVQTICYDEIRWKILKNIRRDSESTLVSVPV